MFAYKLILKEIIDSYDSELIFNIDSNIKIDFIDIFPKSHEERKKLEIELKNSSKLIEKDNKGEYYLLNDPIITIYGELKIAKLRIFDKIKENRGSMDFRCSDYYLIKEKLKNKEGVYIITRKYDELIEIPIKNNYIYISNNTRFYNY